MYIYIQYIIVHVAQNITYMYACKYVYMLQGTPGSRNISQYLFVIIHKYIGLAKKLVFFFGKMALVVLGCH